MMTPSPKTHRNLGFYLVGLGIALGVAVFLSPWASSDPDGLDRVAEDLEFQHQAQADPLSKQLPFAQVFDEYAVQGVPDGIATPLAGFVGTLVTFGLAWGLGKVLRGPKATPPTDADNAPSSHPPVS